MEQSSDHKPKEAEIPSRTEKASAFSFEVGGIEIKAFKKYFKYPEKIQKETGILGYHRTIIDKPSLTDFIKKYYQTKHNINLEEWGFTGIDSMDELNKTVETKFEKEADLDRKETANFRKSVSWQNFLKSDSFRILDLLRELDVNVGHKLLYGLSDGEYPNKCFIHEMGADYNEDKRKEFHENFARSRFFIQKIYDIDYIKKLDETDIQTIPQWKRDSSGSYIFNAVGNGGNVKSNINLFNKETGEKVSKNDWDLIVSLGREYYDRIKNGELFACTPSSGFNIEVGRFTFNNEKLTKTRPSFGFSMNDNFFNEYLHKALEIYTKELKGFNWEKMYKENTLADGGIMAIVQEIVLMDSNVQGLIYEEYEYEPYKGENFISGDKSQELTAEIQKVITAIEKRHNINLSDFVDMDNILDRLYDNQGGIGYELRLPVFIGHDEIPQLQWGHAKYAHYMSSKGFNFFEFEHANELPKST